MATQPPANSLQPFIELAQSLREAAANHDYATVGSLVIENLAPEMVSVMVYVTTPQGHLTIVGGYFQLWSPMAPSRINREPSLGDMAVILRAAARR